VWGDLFSRSGSTYRQPKLVLFSNAVQSACGFAESAVGPFYCPGDEKVYLDMAFFRDLSATLDAPGDFAQAYVIAHEVGHHVQNLLGITGKVHGMRGRVSEEEYNRLSVKLELQADFLAGVWAHHAHRSRQILESGDIEEALNAASAIGDDRLQRRMQGYVVPDAFTHGSSDQRVRWFRKGLETGDPSKGDTFGTDQL
jgi:predicted metalloprotease